MSNKKPEVTMQDQINELAAAVTAIAGAVAQLTEAQSAAPAPQPEVVDESDTTPLLVVRRTAPHRLDDDAFLSAFTSRLALAL